MAPTAAPDLIIPGIEDVVADAKRHGTGGISEHSMVLNMGPQHPSTHGVLQVVPLTDRIDYLCPMINNLAYCLAVEKLLELEIPERAVVLRVLLNELTRIQSHLVWLGTHAMDIGALTVFLYCFREREELLRIFEAVAGQRMMTSYIRIGGLSLEPPRDLYDKIRDFLKDFPSKVDEYEGLLNKNPIWLNRIK